MDDKEYYLELYKIQWDRYDKIRDFEWKVTVGLWVGIGVFTYSVIGKVEIPNKWLLLGIYGALWFIYTFCWHVGGSRRNKENIDYMKQYKAVIEGNKEKKGEEVNRVSWFEGLKSLWHWSRGSQIIATALLLFLSWSFLCHSNQKQENEFSKNRQLINNKKIKFEKLNKQDEDK